MSAVENTCGPALQEIDSMIKTVTSLFHSELHAIAAAKHLEQTGISRDDIDIWSTPHNLPPLLEDEGLSRADAYAYAEGVLRGGSVIIVKCNAGDVDRVVGILDQEGVLDLDEQQVTWRSQGWQEDAGATASSSGTPDTTQARTDVVIDRSDEVGHGRVRIQPRSIERPGQE
jgi:hypothetical protein